MNTVPARIRKAARLIVTSVQGNRSLNALATMLPEVQVLLHENGVKVRSHSQALLQNAELLVLFGDGKKNSTTPASSFHPSLPDNEQHSTFKMVITPTSMTWYYQEIVVHHEELEEADQHSVLMPILEDVLSLLVKHDGSLGSRELALLFGLHSPAYRVTLYILQKTLNERARLNEKVHHAWLTTLNVHHANNIGKNTESLRQLLFHHVYYLLVLLLVVTHRLNACQGHDCIETIKMVSRSHPQVLRKMVLGDELISILLELGEEINETINLLGGCLHGHMFLVEDLFRDLYQQLSPLETRQHLGEFYTPTELAQLMVTHAYRLGMEVLDPACGSGTFIVETLKAYLREKGSSEKDLVARDDKLLVNIWGFDVHPLAVMTTRANMILVLHAMMKKEAFLTKSRILENVLGRIQRVDFLSLLEMMLDEKNSRWHHHFDLIIGNPPWIVLNKLDDATLKQRIKVLAKKMDLLPQPHQVSNLEVSALFFHGAKHFLKRNGTVFLIVSNAFLTGDNHARTRQFADFDDLEAWKLDADLFRIHSTCIKARYRPGTHKNLKDVSRVQVRVKFFAVTRSTKRLHIQLQNEEVYIPYSIDPVNQSMTAKNGKDTSESRFYVKKFIPRAQKSEFLPLGKSYYYGRCYNGAVLGPRNLLFVKILNDSDKDASRNLVELVPVIENPKKPWDFNPLTELGLKKVIVERRYVFPAIRSINVVPFLVLKHDHVFLPIETDERTGGYRFLTDKSTKAWQYFSQLERLYQKFKKTTQSLSTLWDNINYQNKLTAPRQRSPYKVVMQGSGTIVKAVVVNNPHVVIDSTNYILACDSLEEAHYLVGILNAPRMTKTIRLIQAEGAGGGGRHIQKRPFSVAIPKHDPLNPIHQQIAAKAREMERKSRKIFERWKQKEMERLKTKNRENHFKIKPMTVQNQIYKQLDQDFQGLDELVLRLFEE